MKTRGTAFTVVLALVLVACAPLAAQDRAAADRAFLHSLKPGAASTLASGVPDPNENPAISVCSICLLIYNNCLSRCTSNPSPCATQCETNFVNCIGPSCTCAPPSCFSAS